MPPQTAFASVSRALRAVVSMLAFCLPMAAGAADIRIGGTGNALGTIRLLGEAFAQSRPDTKVVVLPSIGTSGAIKAVPKGAIEIGLSSRGLTEDESRTGLVTQEYAQSPTVLAVHKNIKATSVTLSQLSDIYNGKVTTWPDGTRIRPVMRQPGDDNTRQIKALSADVEKAVAVAEQQPGALFAVTDQEGADKMEAVPGSIGVTTIALIRSENRSLHALAIGGVEPTPENARTGRYPLVKHFYFVLPKAPSAAVLDFVAFVQSPAGRKILERTGHTVP